jgi:hypothetical protein
MLCFVEEPAHGCTSGSSAGAVEQHVRHGGGEHYRGVFNGEGVKIGGEVGREEFAVAALGAWESSQGKLGYSVSTESNLLLRKPNQTSLLATLAHLEPH